MRGGLVHGISGERGAAGVRRLPVGHRASRDGAGLSGEGSRAGKSSPGVDGGGEAPGIHSQ